MKDSDKKKKRVMCCPHCADSKFPCVNMEKAMKKESGGKK